MIGSKNYLMSGGTSPPAFSFRFAGRSRPPGSCVCCRSLDRRLDSGSLGPASACTSSSPPRVSGLGPGYPVRTRAKRRSSSVVNRWVPRGPIPDGDSKPRETAVRSPDADRYRRNRAASLVVRNGELMAASGPNGQGGFLAPPSSGRPSRHVVSNVVVAVACRSGARKRATCRELSEPTWALRSWNLDAFTATA